MSAADSIDQSTAGWGGAEPVLDVSGTKPTPFGRLVGVELRKMADTRAGLWLMIAIALITAAIVVIFFFAADQSERTFENFIGMTATPQGFLLPIMGILLVTSEWSQRTALTTFSLTPSRAKVVAAKTVAAVLLGLAAVVVAVAIAALATLVGGADDPWGTFTLAMFAKFALLQLMTIIQGLAFGLILLNSPAAIVLYFVLPIGFSIVANVWGALRDVAAWIDLGTAQGPLFDTVALGGEEWAQLGTASLIWIILPFLAGLWRVLRAEVK